MKYFIYITAAMMVIYIIYKSLQPWWYKNRMQKAAKEYTGHTVGKVIGTEKDIRTDFFAYVFSSRYNRYLFKKNLTYYVYSSVVEYEVNGISYTIDALDYSVLKPVMGRCALVLYNEYVPSQAYVCTYRKYKNRLKVQKMDEEYLYGSCGLKRKIKIPIEEVEEKVYVGDYLVNKYGFYFKEQLEDRKYTPMDMLNETSKSFLGENEEWKNYNK